MRDCRVLVLSSMYPRENNSSAGIFIHHQVRNLVMLGCNIVVVCPLPSVPRLLATNARRLGYRETPPEITMDGIRVLYPRYIRPPGNMFHATSSYQIAHVTSRVIHKLGLEFRPDILHAHTATPHGYAGLLTCQRFGFPLVVSLRGSDVDIYPHRDRLTRRMTKIVLTKADHLTSVSRALKSSATKIASLRKDISVVYTGCDLNVFLNSAEKRKAFRERLRISEESILLVFIGRLSREKGIIDLGQAFIRTCRAKIDVQLLCVGSGKDGKLLADMMNAAGVQDKLHFLDARPHEEIPGWLNAADVLVLPSWHEGLPNVVVEAMACERPVIATDVGGIPEVVEDGRNGILVKKNDINGLYNAIIQLSTDPSKRKLMGTYGRRTVKRKFAWQKNAQAVRRIYESLLLGDL